LWETDDKRIQRRAKKAASIKRRERIPELKGDLGETRNTVLNGMF